MTMEDFRYSEVVGDLEYLLKVFNAQGFQMRAEMMERALKLIGDMKKELDSK